MEDTKEKKRIEFEMTRMVLDTYNKIAIWNNSDFDTPKQKSDALKIVSQDITQNIIDQVFAGINGVKTGVTVIRGDVTVGENESNTETVSEKDEKEIFNKLFITKPKE